jgi:hypothetical protein
VRRPRRRVEATATALALSTSISVTFVDATIRRFQSLPESADSLVPIRFLQYSLLGLLGMGLVGQCGCTSVPPHDGLANVRVSDVVRRVKCDIRDAVLQTARYRDEQSGKAPLLFLTEWAAKVHMTIAVDDTAAITPGLTYSDPLDKPVATRLIPATTEFFTLGVGGGFTTQAIRTEDIEFLFSLKEVEKDFTDDKRRNGLFQVCNTSGQFLESDLGLQPLIESAVKPIKDGVLKAGPEAIGPGPPPPAGKVMDDKATRQALKDLAAASKPVDRGSLTIESALSLAREPGKFDYLVQEFKDVKSVPFSTLDANGNRPAVHAINVISDVTQAGQIEKHVQNVINNVVKPLDALYSPTLPPACLKTVNEFRDEAIQASIDVSIAVDTINTANEKHDQETIETQFTKLKGFADTVSARTMSMAQAISGKTCQTPKPKDVASYDPIDLISEQVTFYVTLTGSVSPAWKLVAITSPIAPSLFTATRKDTNTMILALGRPAAQGGLSGNVAVSNQILAGMLSQALSNQRPFGQ